MSEKQEWAHGLLVFIPDTHLGVCAVSVDSRLVPVKLLQPKTNYGVIFNLTARVRES